MSDDLCDVCGGTGKPENDLPCICCGSGRGSDEKIGLRIEITRLREENAMLLRLANLAPDAEKYQWAIKNSRWIRHEHEAYVAVPVDKDADLSCVAMRNYAIEKAMGKNWHNRNMR